MSIISMILVVIVAFLAGIELSLIHISEPTRRS